MMAGDRCPDLRPVLPVPFDAMCAVRAAGANERRICRARHMSRTETKYIETNHSLCAGMIILQVPKKREQTEHREGPGAGLYLGPGFANPGPAY